MPESDSKQDKKKRKSVPRSSAGCVTCKLVILCILSIAFSLTVSRARHIKCDEKKPPCSNCLKSNRQCDGYSIVGPRPDQPSVKIVHWKPSALALHQMSVDLAGEREERRAFHFFRSNSVGVLQGYFDSEFWSRLILQASHTDPAIKHAVVALGSLHEAILTGESRLLNNGKAHDNFALQHCNKAIANLNKGLRGEGQKSIEVLLMSCVIFVCFETLQGNYESALSHMESGIRVYRSWQLEQSKHSAFKTSNIHHAIDKEIAQIVSRLNLQTLLFVDTHLLNPKWYAQNIIPPIDPPPESFGCLNDARDRLDNCTNYIFESTIVSFFSNAHTAAERCPETQIHHSLLSQWLDLFDTFMKKSGRSLGLEDRQRATLLRVQYKASRILTATGISPQETAFDAFNPDFDSIVTLMSSLIENGQGSGVSERTRQFSFDTGVVPPLYFTATRCRNPSIRRRAMSLLAATHRQEGVWNSEMLAKIAERVIAIEEDGVDQVTSSSDVAATSRLSVLNATIYSEQRRVLVELCRPTGNENGEWDLLDEWIEY
jgi:hypothetical protein